MEYSLCNSSKHHNRCCVFFKIRSIARLLVSTHWGGSLCNCKFQLNQQLQQRRNILISAKERITRLLNKNVERILRTGRCTCVININNGYTSSVSADSAFVHCDKSHCNSTVTLFLRILLQLGFFLLKHLPENGCRAEKLGLRVQLSALCPPQLLTKKSVLHKWTLTYLFVTFSFTLHDKKKW